MSLLILPSLLRARGIERKQEKPKPRKAKKYTIKEYWRAFSLPIIRLHIEKKKYEEKNKKRTCECGQVLDFTPSILTTNEKRVCPNCGKILYVDETPIDWEKNAQTKGEYKI